MNRRAFTLIELLAVIVILAIIALIAVPIVINIINDSKKESINRSIELYIDHVQKIIAKEQMKDPTFNPSECEIKPEGKLLCGTKEIQIEMKGQVPKSGKIKFSKGMVVEGVNLELDGLYYQVKDDKVSEGTKEKEYSAYITLENDLAPTGLSVGDKYTYEVNDKDTFNFYVLYIEENKVHLIMDRNICGSATDVNESTNGESATTGNNCLIAWHAGSEDNTYGPDTAMQGIHNATKEWTNVPNMELTYTDDNNIGTNNGYTGLTINDGIATITGKPTTKTTTIGTSLKPLKARLPRESEVTSELNRCGVYDHTDPSFYVSGSCSLWIVDNLQSSSYYPTSTYPEKQNISGIQGYWILSSYKNYSTHSYVVYYDGFVGNYGTSKTSAGLRPVITLLKSNFDKQ